ncbi:MAG TPA: hydantoinase B/oxoprolinase family protein [Acidimicrobiia bacterium]|nr:hydantoinase B/oxoprolinase family protein [Acidimicrobiia bacterium]
MPTDAVTPTIDDPITSEIIRNGLMVAVEEASIAVVRSSHSSFIQEGADACAALLDADGGLVAQSTTTSLMHSASLRCSLPALLADVPAASMAPGDVFAQNDPYRGGIHANDIVVFRPIFAEGRVVFFAGTLIHVADVGGISVAGLAALATDTFAEGLLLPPVRLYAADEPVADVIRIIERNSRAPDKVIGDVKALVAGTSVIARRVGELADRYGAGTLVRFARHAMDHAERQMRAGLARIPPGTYEGAFEIDGDGVDADREFTVRVAVTLDGSGGVELDFAGTSPQARGMINSSYSQTLSGVLYAVRCFVDPTIAMNEGCFRPLTTRLPPGTLVNPAPPAACGGRLMTVAAAVEAILGALSAARPDHAVGASSLIHVWTLTGVDPSGQRWLNLFYEFGGLGARTGKDGPDATGAFFLGGRSVIPQLEPLEAQYPFVVRSTRLWPDSGGPGEARGGLGVETVIELLTDAEVTVRGARMDIPPPGRGGGHPGAAGTWSVERLDGASEVVPAKATNIPLAAGERFVLRTSGGGGLGPPERRDPRLVLDDVRSGKVTVAGAARDYGVVIDVERDAVDAGATAALRAERSGRHE